MRDGGAEPLLVFSLGGDAYAFRMRDVRGLAACSTLRPVPGTPPAVLGLTEWRGAVLTIVDLARLLGQAAPDAPACLIRLAEPLRGVAFHLPAVVRVRTASPESCGRLLDPARLLRRLDSALRGER